MGLLTARAALRLPEVRSLSAHTQQVTMKAVPIRLAHCMEDVMDNFFKVMVVVKVGIDLIKRKGFCILLKMNYLSDFFF